MSTFLHVLRFSYFCMVFTAGTALENNLCFDTELYQKAATICGRISLLRKKSLQLAILEKLPSYLEAAKLYTEGVHKEIAESLHEPADEFGCQCLYFYGHNLCDKLELKNLTDFVTYSLSNDQYNDDIVKFLMFIFIWRPDFESIWLEKNIYTLLLNAFYKSRGENVDIITILGSIIRGLKMKHDFVGVDICIYNILEGIFLLDLDENGAYFAGHLCFKYVQDNLDEDEVVKYRAFLNRFIELMKDPKSNNRRVVYKLGACILNYSSSHFDEMHQICRDNFCEKFMEFALSKRDVQALINIVTLISHIKFNDKEELKKYKVKMLELFQEALISKDLLNSDFDPNIVKELLLRIKGYFELCDKQSKPENLFLQFINDKTRREYLFENIVEGILKIWCDELLNSEEYYEKLHQWFSVEQMQVYILDFILDSSDQKKNGNVYESILKLFREKDYISKIPKREFSDFIENLQRMFDFYSFNIEYLKFLTNILNCMLKAPLDDVKISNIKGLLVRYREITNKTAP